MSIYRLILFIYVVCIFPIFSGDITFLPAYITGNPPDVLTKKDDISNGIAQLGSFYAKENFQTQISDFDDVKKFLSSMTMNSLPNKKPDKVLLSSVCSEFESDYLIKSEIDFSKKIYILTEVYNCRGTLIASHDSIVSLDFFWDYESNIKNVLNFLPQKANKKLTLSTNDEKKEIIFVLDISGSLSREMKKSIQFIQGLLDDQSFSIGLLLVSSKKNQFIKPETQSNQARVALNQIKFVGEVSPRHLFNGLSSLKSNYSKKSKHSRIVIITDTVLTNENNSELYNSVHNLKQVGFDVHLVTGSFFSNKSFALHEKVARAGGNELHKLMHFQKIGTTNGYRVVYLHDQVIYFSEGENPVSISKLDDLVQVDQKFVYSIAKFPNPDNMSDIYAKASKEKILEKGKIYSNIEDILQNLSYSAKIKNSRSKRILIKTSGNKTIWIQIPSAKGINVNKEVFIKTTFVREKYTSRGFSNLIEETFVYKGDVPKLLLYTPAEIAKYFQENPTKYLSGFMKGVVLEVR